MDVASGRNMRSPKINTSYWTLIGWTIIIICTVWTCGDGRGQSAMDNEV
jgi:hypothetical protein